MRSSPSLFAAWFLSSKIQPDGYFLSPGSTVRVGKKCDGNIVAIVAIVRNKKVVIKNVFCFFDQAENNKL